MNTPQIPAPADIAIIGMDCLFPDAPGLKEYWRLLRRGEDAVREIPPSHFALDDYFDADPKSPDRIYCRRGAFLEPVEFDPVEFGIPPAVLEATDTAQLLALLVAKGALADAGYAPSSIENQKSKIENRKLVDSTRVGVILGVTGTQELVISLGARLGHPHWRRALENAGADAETVERVVQEIGEAYVGWQENSFPGLLGNVVAGRIANRLNLKGTNCVVDAACASSLSALHLAVMELQTHRADMLLTGGVDALNDIFMFMCFAKTQALSASGDAKPFAADSDGTVLGEGVGMLVLKRLADAERDGDRIYAVIKGIGTSSDGRAQSIYAPRSEGQAIALRNAYAISGVSPATVELVEAHGTGTRVGDVVEFEALRTVYEEAGAEPRQCAIGSVKSQIGHTKAAAGVASLIKAVLALRNRTLPATLKVGEPNPKLGLDESPFYLSTQTRPWFTASAASIQNPKSEIQSPLRRAAVSSFGFGGSNFHVVLEEHAEVNRTPAWDGSVEIIAMNAGSPETLIAKLEDWADFVASILPQSDPGSTDRNTTQNPNSRIQNPQFRAALARRAWQSRADFRADAPYRITLVCERDDDLAGLIAAAREAVRTRGTESAWTAGNVFFGGPQQPGELAFLFPGQGSQYVGMGRDLVCVFPEAFAALESANAIGMEKMGTGTSPGPNSDATAVGMAPDGAAPIENRKSKIENRPLTDLIYPPPSFDAETRREHESALRQTEVTQPALGAVNVAFLRVLERFGMKAACVAGHSFGELVALHAAGVIDESSLHELARLRGRLMADTGGDGAMLAVTAPLEELAELLRERDFGVVLANRNSPTQGILSGPKAAIDAIAGFLEKQKGWRTKLLEVSAAFHTDLMASAEKKFRAALDRIPFHAAMLRVYANCTGRPYSTSADEMRDLLAKQLTHPVMFLDEIRNLYETGVRTFVEVGPKQVLTGLAGSILNGLPHHAISLDASSGKRMGVVDIARAVALVAVLGHVVDLTQWEQPPPPVTQPQMAVSLLGVNYRAPNLCRTTDQSRDRKVSHSMLRGAVAARAVLPSRVDESQSQHRKEAVADNARQVASAGLVTVLTGSPPAIVVPSIQNRKSEIENSSTGSPPMSYAPDSLTAALQTVHEGLRHMQALQQQTAAAHHRFLETQERAHYAFQSLMDSHQRLVERLMGLPVSPAAAPPPPVAAPIPTVAAYQPAPTPAYPPMQGAMPAAVASAWGNSAPPSPAYAPAGPEMVYHPAPPPQFVDVYARHVPAGRALETAAPVPIAPVAPYILAPVAGNGRHAHTPQYQSATPPAPAYIQPADLASSASPAARFEPVVPAMQPVETQPRSATPSPATAIARTLESPQSKIENQKSEIEVDFPTVLLEVVAELTGYPVEMLKLDMDMEADLGIDSIKRLEILSGVQRRLPDLRQVDSQYVGSLRTLKNIIDHMAGAVDAPPRAASATDGATGSASKSSRPSGKRAAAGGGPSDPKSLAPAGAN